MSNQFYDRLKAIALLLVPVLTFAGSIVNILNVPYAPQITAILAGADTCLGSVVVIANKLYKGNTEVEGDE